MADVDSSKLKPYHLAMEIESDGWWDDDGNIYTWPISIAGWGARVECRGFSIDDARQLAESIVDAQTMCNALLLKIAELELLADDARGKRCPECSAPMVSLSTIDGGQRVCSGCDKVWSWHLKEGQPPLIGNNRMVKKV